MQVRNSVIELEIPEQKKKMCRKNRKKVKEIDGRPYSVVSGDFPEEMKE